MAGEVILRGVRCVALFAADLLYCVVFGEVTKNESKFCHFHSIRVTNDDVLCDLKMSQCRGDGRKTSDKISESWKLWVNHVKNSQPQKFESKTRRNSSYPFKLLLGLLSHSSFINFILPPIHVIDFLPLASFSSGPLLKLCLISNLLILINKSKNRRNFSSALVISFAFLIAVVFLVVEIVVIKSGKNRWTNENNRDDGAEEKKA